MEIAIPLIALGGMYVVSNQSNENCSKNEIKQEQKWLNESADKIESILQLNDLEKKLSIDAGFKQVEKFNLKEMIDKIERMYNEILLKSKI